MKKRGLDTGIDWIIAIGMFLVYMGLTLVLFRPGVTPEFEAQTLLDVAQAGVEANLSWEIVQRPMFTEMMQYEIEVPDPSDPGDTITVTRDSTYHNEQLFLFNSIFDCPGGCTGSPKTLQAPAEEEFTFRTTVIPALGVQDTGRGGNAQQRQALRRNRMESRLYVYYIPSSPTDIPPPSTVEPQSYTRTTLGDLDNVAQDEGDAQGPTGGAITEVPNFFTAAAVQINNLLTGFQSSNPGSGNQQGPSNAPSAEEIEEAAEPRNDADTVQTEENLENTIGRETALDQYAVKYGIWEQTDELFIPVYTAGMVPGEKRKYLLVYSTEVINNKGGTLTSPGRGPSNPNVGGARPNTRHACVIRDLNNPPTFGQGPVDSANSDCKLRYTLGVPEILDGLSVRKIDNFLFRCGQTTTQRRQQDPPAVREAYECIKEKWGFPDNRDFRIDIVIRDPDTGDQIDRIIFPDIAIPEEARVDVRQFNTFILHKDATRAPAVVSIATW